MAATRSKDTYLQALYRRQRSRIGHGKAIGAVKHSILCACWHMLTTGELYREAGGDYFTNATPNAPPGASSPNSNASDTPSPSSRQPPGANVFSPQSRRPRPPPFRPGRSTRRRVRRPGARSLPPA